MAAGDDAVVLDLLAHPKPQRIITRVCSLDAVKQPTFESYSATPLPTPLHVKYILSRPSPWDGAILGC